MTVDAKCVWKYVSHDWRQAATAIIHALIVVLAFLIVFAGIAILGVVVTSLITTTNLLVIITSGIFMLSTVAIALLWNKDSFVVNTYNKYDHTIVKTETMSTWTICFASIGSEIVVCIIYGFYTAFYDGYQSTAPLIVLFSVGIIVFTPICCAIARCKE